MNMKDFILELYIILFFTREGVWGAQLTINVMTGASVILECSLTEDLRRCSCDSDPSKCITDCRSYTAISSYVSKDITTTENRYTFSELKRNDSRLYVCCNYQMSYSGKKYLLNVSPDRDPKVVIGTLAGSVKMPCNTGRSVLASEKYWCRVGTGGACQPETVMSHDNDTLGEFRIIDINGSFSLEKRNLNQNDSGHYKCVINADIQKGSKSLIVELHVQEGTSPKLSLVTSKDNLYVLLCQYPQQVQQLQKHMLCDNQVCPETVKMVDNHFHSALEVSIETCSKIQHYTCWVTTNKGNLYSNNLGPSKSFQQFTFSNLFRDLYDFNKIEVIAGNVVNIICNIRHYPEWHPDIRYDEKWCKYNTYASYLCEHVTTNRIRQGFNKLTIETCFTTSDSGKYRCKLGHLYINIVIEVKVPPPPPTPLEPPKPVTPTLTIPPVKNESYGLVVGTLLIIGIVFLAGIAGYIIKKLKKQRLQNSTLAQMSAVDVHANMYAYSVAKYYKQNPSQSPTELADGDDDDDSSSSSSNELATEYTTVARPSTLETTHTCSDMASHGCYEDAIHPCQNDKGHKFEAKYKLNNKDEDDDDDVTYAQVTIKPKAITGARRKKI